MTMGQQWGGKRSGENIWKHLKIFEKFQKFQIISKHLNFFKHLWPLLVIVYGWGKGHLCIGYIFVSILKLILATIIVCLVHILFVCLFKFFITMLSWCLKLKQSRHTQWTVNSGGPWVGKETTWWQGGDGSGENFFLPSSCNWILCTVVWLFNIVDICDIWEPC